MKSIHQPRTRFGIQTRILASLLAFGMLPAGLMAVIGHWMMARTALWTASQELADSAERIALSTNDRLRRALRTIDEVSSEIAPLLARTQPTARTTSLETRMREIADSPVTTHLRSANVPPLRSFRGVIVCDTLGSVVGAIGGLSTTECANEQWFKSVLQGGRGTVYIGRPTATATGVEVEIAVPVLDQLTLRPVGAMLGRFDFTDVIEMLDDAAFNSGGAAALLTASGDILVGPSDSRLDRSRITDILAPYHPTSHTGPGLTGKSVVAGIALVPSTRRSIPNDTTPQGWSVWVERNQADILAPTHRFGRNAVLLILLTAVLVIVVGTTLSSGITRPLRELRDNAHAIGTGKLDARIHLKTGDEIETLAADFNRMAERLAESYRSLENRVRTATAELAREKDSLQAIISALGEGLMVIDTERRIVLWNRAAEAMTGYPAEETIGRHCASILWTGSTDKPDICSTDCPALRAFAERRPIARRDLNTYIQTKSGDRLPVSYTASPLYDEHERIRGCVVVLHDVSQEKQIDELKTDMISLVSHELRTPLSAIIGFAELLQDASTSPSDREEFLRIIINEGRRMAGLVEDFLTISRIEAGRFELQLTDTDLRAIVDSVIGLLSRQYPNHELVNELPADLPHVQADANRIERVVANLLSNAIKYSPNGGRVRVWGRDIGDKIEVAVSDQGIGIRPEDIPKLFRRFQRVNREATPDVTGTGLGLSICKSIITEHGGTIRVESEYGRGSTFYFTLPKSGPAKRPPSSI